VPPALRRLDRFDLAVLAALFGLSMVVLAMLATKGRPLSGADGLLASDQLQYFAWIREASGHVLIGNLYDLAPGDRVFLHPMFAISGGLAALGISIPLSYLLWKPVAVAALFAGIRAYVHRLLEGTWERRVALVLALFAVMPAAWIVAWTDWGGNPRQYTFDFISGEMWTGQYLWGYLPTAIAVGLMPVMLLMLERGRTAWAAAIAFLVCWLQPWQGATLGLIVVAVALWRRERPSVAVLGALGVPALYYFLLSRLDDAWALASEANRRGAMAEWSWPWWAIVLTVAPLAVPAALAYRLPAQTWQEQAVRVWPLAALAVFLQPFGTFPYHAFQGLAIPLSILAVQAVVAGVPRVRPALVVGVVVLFTVPGMAHKLSVSVNSIRSAGDPHWVFPGEVEALQWLESDPRPGGVLAATYAGHMIPYRTGRETYVGALSWSPNWHERSERANELVEGDLRGTEAREFVRSTGARFVFVDCRPGLRDLEADLEPITEEARRFGCAQVYVLQDPGRADRSEAA
jgi:hypothetical protein